MHARFYAPTLTRDGATVDLDADEAHHLRHVLRLGIGAEVLVFDGQGFQVRARLERVTRRGASLTVIGPAAAAAERGLHLTLAQAVLKGDGMDAAIRDATMIGVASIVPVMTTRAVVAWQAVATGRQRERWRRLAVAAAKQCGRAVVPAVEPPLRLSDYLQTEPPATRLILVEPSRGGLPSVELASCASEATRNGAVVLVGPEGGWTADEVAGAVAAGFVPWSLGPLTLRADAVALAALAVLYHAWERTTGSR